MPPLGESLYVCSWLKALIELPAGEFHFCGTAAARPHEVNGGSVAIAHFAKDPDSVLFNLSMVPILAAKGPATLKY